MEPDFFIAGSGTTGTIVGDWEERGVDEEYGEGEDDAEVQQECLQKFSSRDYIMEPSIFNTLKRYFQAGGSPENVIQLLSENYSAVAQTVNLLAEWLIQSGVEPGQVQETVENHLKSLLIKHFDPRKADSIFTEEGEVMGLWRHPFPVVAMGVLKWVDWTVSEPRYFQLQTDHTPVHLALLDEISTCHQLLHPQVLQLLIKLFETEHSQLDVMEQMELKKTLLDRMVHLLSRGYVLPVVTYIRRCLEKLDTDISLIRYFVTEVLDVITPPYTSDFVQLFLPILENDSIAGTIKTEGEHDPVTEFIVHCKSKFIMIN
ncbi:negative elongation factor C/D [Rhinophrynus dorsalis]